MRPLAVPLLSEGLYLAHDPFRHPASAANGIIAWEMARFLMAQGLVPPRRRRIPAEALPSLVGRGR